MHLSPYLSILLLHALSSSALQLPFKAPTLLEDPVKLTQQPDSTSPTDWPYRELPWGEVNVISTTDT